LIIMTLCLVTRLAEAYTPMHAATVPDTGTVFAYNGGALMTHGALVPVLWGPNVNPEVVAHIEDYLPTIMADGPAIHALAEYQIEAGSAKPPVQLTLSRTYGSVIRDDDIRTEITAARLSGILPRSSSIGTLGYIVFFPPGLKILEPDYQLESCTDWCGYH